MVQRALKTLEHAGLISMARGRIQIIDVAALEGWSESESSLLHPRGAEREREHDYLTEAQPLPHLANEPADPKQFDQIPRGASSMG